MIRRGLFIATAAVLLTLGGTPALAGDCAWARQPDGSSFGTCVDNTGRIYCLTCSTSGTGRVCTPAPCPR